MSINTLSGDLVQTDDIGPDTTVVTYHKGEQFVVPLDIQDDSDQPVSITGWTITAFAEFRKYNLSIGSDGAVVPSKMQPSQVPDKTLTVVKSDQRTNPGEFEVQIPSDLFAGDVTPESNIAVNVAVINIVLTDDETFANTSYIYLFMPIRYGKRAPS